MSKKGGREPGSQLIGWGWFAVVMWLIGASLILEAGFGIQSGYVPAYFGVAAFVLLIWGYSRRRKYRKEQKQLKEQLAEQERIEAAVDAGVKKALAEREGE